MSTDDQRPAEPTPAPGPAEGQARGPAGGSAGGGAPDPDALASVATPATVRRAPRFGAFVRAGVLLGALVGWVLAMVSSGTDGEGRTAVVLLSTVGVAAAGAILGAGVALLVDRRSGR